MRVDWEGHESASSTLVVNVDSRNRSLRQHGEGGALPGDPPYPTEAAGRDLFEERESGISLLELSESDEKGGVDHRCHQRTCALAAIILTIMLCSLTYLETLPQDGMQPPPLCQTVQDHVMIAPDVTGVVWEGWGTSLAWWANWAGGLPRENQTVLLDDIFDPVKGLGLTMARYNIGGGGKSPLDKAFEKAPKSFRATPGFRDDPQQPYNFSQDLHQRTILFGARTRGVDSIEAVSYSPPSWMTVSGSFQGASAFKQDNVNASNYLSYASYLGDVVAAYRDLWGLTFATLAPVNEPVEGYWFYPDNQEGCNFSWEAIDEFIPIVHNALVARNLSTKIAAFDSWAVHTAAPLKQFSRATMGNIDYVNVHSYQPQGDQNYKSYLSIRKQLAKVATGAGKSVRVSEWGPQYQEGDELEVALIFARTITLDINVLGVWSWTYWLAVEQGEYTPYWGLIRSTWSYKQPFWRVRRKQYYVMMQFTRWVLPGSLMIRPQTTCQAGLVVAYVAAKSQLVLIATNEEVRSVSLTFRFHGFATLNATARVQIFRTSENEDYSNAGVMEEQYIPGLLSRTLLAKSVTTYVVHGVERRGASP